MPAAAPHQGQRGYDFLTGRYLITNRRELFDGVFPAARRGSLDLELGGGPSRTVVPDGRLPVYRCMKSGRALSGSLVDADGIPGAAYGFGCDCGCGPTCR